MYILTEGNIFSQSAAASEVSSSLCHNMNIQIEASNLTGGETYYGCRSGCSSHVDSPNTAKHLLRRSISSHAIYRGGSYCPLGEPVLRVYSAGYLMGASGYMAQGKGRVDSPVSMSKESSMIIEGMRKASRYSPEEKRERIERYRSKRNLRNFKRKIQYECRKTLADSRTRFKGRFVRNDEISTMMRMMDDNISYDNHLSNDHYSSTQDDEGEETSWFNLLDYSFPPKY